ncbi:hypothetical protein [Euzebya rosea]|uniref:hypothetical protein n=1 Tax=Euzebya rosea TaxID=2052804 RepID=UPI00130023A5|nr:hypothetical protein [Euzebya rosea]
MVTDTSRHQTVSARITAGVVARVLVDYDGASPPHELLDALRRQGWLPLRHLAPPASAIDWDRPDPTQRSGYAIRSYPVRTQGTFEGSDAQRALAIRRAQATIDDLVGPGAGGRRRLGITVTAPVAALARPIVAAHGTILEEWAHRSPRQASYRGQVAAAEKAVHTFLVQVSARLEGELLGALAHWQPDVVDADAVRRPAPPQDDPAAGPPALVHVEVRAQLRDEVVRHLDSIAEVRDSSTTGRTILASYRGVRSEQRHEMTTLTVAVPATVDLTELERDMTALGANAVRRLAPEATPATRPPGTPVSVSPAGGPVPRRRTC